jgi:hypothetical protein
MDNPDNTTELKFDKRFWLFMHEDHEASGGIMDFAGSFDSLADAQTAFIHDGYHSAHIFDHDTKKIVAVWGGLWHWDESTHDYWLTPDSDGWQERVGRAGHFAGVAHDE